MRQGKGGKGMRQKARGKKQEKRGSIADYDNWHDWLTSKNGCMSLTKDIEGGGQVLSGIG